MALKGRGESRSPTLRESSSPRLLLLTTRKEPELGLVQSEVLKQLWARCQRSAQEARCRAGTVVGGEDESGGKGGHRKETCDFLCLLGKTATMPDPQQIRNSPLTSGSEKNSKEMTRGSQNEEKELRQINTKDTYPTEHEQMT